MYEGFGSGVHVVVADGRQRFSAILTAAHAVPSKAHARFYRAMFSQVGKHPRRDVALNPDRLYLHCAPRLDVAIVALNENVRRGHPLVHFRDFDPPTIHLHSLHHGGHTPGVRDIMRVAHGDLLLYSQDFFAIDMPSEEGASGSPVFTDDYRLYGLVIGTTQLIESPTRERKVTEANFLGPLVAKLAKRGLTLAGQAARASAA